MNIMNIFNGNTKLHLSTKTSYDYKCRLEINWKRKNSIEYLVMLKQKQSCLKLNNLRDMYTKIQIQATN